VRASWNRPVDRALVAVGAAVGLLVARGRVADLPSGASAPSTGHAVFDALTGPLWAAVAWIGPAGVLLVAVSLVAARVPRGRVLR
jgi:hypothetical protein